MLLITITSYNKGLYTNKLLNSLVDQIKDKSNVKVLFVDDASDDSTVDIVKSHAIFKLDNFELLTHTEMLWVSESRNEGIKRLNTGDWITFIDGDDFVTDNYIETLLSYMDDNKYDIYMFDYNNYPDDPSIDPESIEKAENTMVWSRLYKADVILENNILFRDKPYKEQGFGEDYAFNEELRIIGATEKATGDIIYNYRWGVPNSLSNTLQPEIPDEVTDIEE